MNVKKQNWENIWKTGWQTWCRRIYLLDFPCSKVYTKCGTYTKKNKLQMSNEAHRKNQKASHLFIFYKERVVQAFGLTMLPGSSKTPAPLAQVTQNYPKVFPEHQNYLPGAFQMATGSVAVSGQGVQHYQLLQLHQENPWNLLPAQTLDQNNKLG